MNERALVALLVLVALVIGSNLVLFGIVRSIMRGDHGWMDGIMKSFTHPLRGAQAPMDELRRRVSELPGRDGVTGMDDPSESPGSQQDN
jgi:hypothetical protein